MITASAVGILAIGQAPASFPSTRAVGVDPAKAIRATQGNYMEPENVKVFFEIVQDEDGYPDCTVESVWAMSTDVPGEYIIDNIPFYARVATCGDIVRVRVDAEGVRWFESVVREAECSLMRVIVRDEANLPGVIEALQNLGCEVERARGCFFAVSIPFAVELEKVQAWLAEREGGGMLYYEEPILRYP
jgi:hypothetical protein